MIGIISRHLFRASCTVVGFLIAVIGIFCGFYVFPNSIYNEVSQSMKLINGSVAYQRWEKLPIPLKFKVYLFNVTNPAEVQLGAKPKVQEVGPYIYDEYRQKQNISSDNANLTYYQKQYFTFNEAASFPHKESDVLTLVNLPLMAILYSLLGHNPGYNNAINELFDKPKDLFLKTTVKQFLFDGIPIACNHTSQGFLDPAKAICKIAKKKRIPQITTQKDGNLKFSLLSHKNNTDDGSYTINSGIDDIRSLGSILKWQNVSTLKTWGTSASNNKTCNQISGTDATIFPPYLTQQSNLSTYVSDICRSVKLQYESDTLYKDVFGFKFTADKSMLSSVENCPSNECFCNNKTKIPENFLTINRSKCLLDGAMDLSLCQKAPVIMTNPHFYLANKIYGNSVDGLKPNATKHSTFVIIEPTSGTILHGSKKAQFNIVYKKFVGINLTANLTNSLIPIAWIDEGAELNDDMMNILDQSFLRTLRLLRTLYWSLIVIGITISLFSSIGCIFFGRKELVPLVIPIPVSEKIKSYD